MAGTRLIALALAVAGPVVAASALVAPAPLYAQADQAAHKRACDELALVVAPDGIVPIQIESLLAATVQQMAEDPDIKFVESAYPGTIQAAVDGIRPLMLKAAYRFMPRYRADLSQLYQDNLTTAEALEAADFFRTPEMQAFMLSANRNVRFERSTSALLAERDASDADVRADLRSAAVRTADETTPAQRRMLADFMASPLGIKLAALNSQKAAIGTKWFNHSDPELEREIELATADAIIEHIAKTDPETAKAMRKELEAEDAQSKGS